MKSRVCSRLGAVFFLALLFSIGFVVAAPPVQQTEILISGIVMESPIIETHPANSDYKFHLHAYNASDGRPLTNDTTTCFLHLYRPSNGGHQLEADMNFDSNGVDFELEILGGNFTEVGQYAVLMDCDAPFIGGFIEYGFDVTPTGQMLEDPNMVLVYALLGLALIFLTLSFSFKENYWMLKSLFEFLAVLSGLIAVNSAKIIASQSDTLGIMGTSGLILIIVVVALFFLWMFVRAFKEIIKIFKEKGALRWDYD